MRACQLSLTVISILWALIAGPAHARILGTGGAAVVIAPPAISAPNVLQSNTQIYVWEEKQDYVTTTSIPYNIDGTPGTYNAVSSVMTTGGTLFAGTFVDSHMIHFDQLGPGTTTLTGFVEFEDPITAVMVLCDELDSGDGDIGWSSTAYADCASTGSFRPVDWVTTGDNEAIVISGDRLRISFTLRTSNVFDQIRVVTQPGAVASVPVSGALATALLLLLLIGVGVTAGGLLYRRVVD